MQPRKMKQIIDRKLYNTETATLLSGDDYWDGNNWERCGTNIFLYRTKKGSYFSQHLTQWQGQQDCLIPLTESEAIELFELHQTNGEIRQDFEFAFPNVEVLDA
jgi:hypothetical protein